MPRGIITSDAHHLEWGILGGVITSDAYYQARRHYRPTRQRARYLQRALPRGIITLGALSWMCITRRSDIMGLRGGGRVIMGVQYLVGSLPRSCITRHCGIMAIQGGEHITSGVHYIAG